MEQFAAVAIAHFLALLIPGVDFFLVARTAMANGWRIATGACLGIASANGIFIAAAFSGLSLISNPTVLAMIQLVGSIFLIVIGIAFFVAKSHFDPTAAASAVRETWLKGFALGLASGLLNPKNALFYLSLATVLAGASKLTLLGYGVWMFAMVFIWDVVIARALGSERALKRMGAAVPWLTKIAGSFLVVLGVVMLLGVVMDMR